MTLAEFLLNKNIIYLVLISLVSLPSACKSGKDKTPISLEINYIDIRPRGSSRFNSMTFYVLFKNETKEPLIISEMKILGLNCRDMYWSNNIRIGDTIPINQTRVYGHSKLMNPKFLRRKNFVSSCFIEALYQNKKIKIQMADDVTIRDTRKSWIPMVVDTIPMMKHL